MMMKILPQVENEPQLQIHVRHFFQAKVKIFSYFAVKTYVIGTH